MDIQTTVVMIDHIVCHIQSPELAKSLLENNLLDFGLKRSERTGQIFNKGRQDGKLLNFRIKIWPSGFIKLAGSPHTFYNALNGNTNKWGVPMNHNTFTHEMLRDSIGNLSRYLNVDPVDASVHQIEFGVNLNLPLSTRKIIDSFIAYNKYPFDRMKNMRGKGYGRESCLSQYRIKAYDKALEFRLLDNIFRFEYATNKMQPVFGKQKIYLADLLDLAIWDSLGKILLKTLDDCIVLDETNKPQLSSIEQKLIEECGNPRKWENFNTKERYHRRERFNDLMSKHGQLQIKQKIEEAIKNELAKMLSLSH